MRAINTDWIKNTYEVNSDGYPKELQPNVVVLCAFRNGHEFYSRVNFFDWRQLNDDDDIMEYRTVTPAELKELNKKYERTLKSIIN